MIIHRVLPSGVVVETPRPGPGRCPACAWPWDEHDGFLLDAPECPQVEDV